MTFYPPDPVTMTQVPRRYLANPLHRASLRRLLNDASNQQSAVVNRRPLKVVTAIEQKVIDSLVSTYGLTSAQGDILARIGLEYTNADEMVFLKDVIGGPVAVAVQALAPLLWFRMNESAGPVVNYGSAGSAFNLTPTSIGAFQSAGPNNNVPYAMTFDGASSQMISPVSSLPFTNVTSAWLVLANTNGQNSAGFCIDCFVSGSSNFQLSFFGSAGRLQSFERNTTLNGATTVTATPAGDWFPFGKWRWIFNQFNATTNQARIWSSINGVLTEFNYASQSTMTGTLLQAQQITVGNNRTSVRAWDGKIAQGILFPQLLSTAQMQAIIDASEVNT